MSRVAASFPRSSLRSSLEKLAAIYSDSKIVATCYCNLRKKYKIVPVAAINNYENVCAVMNALIYGGLPLIEVTFRTDAAEETIKAIKNTFSESVCVGAGTVLNLEQAKQAISAGAEFIVSPGFNEKVVDFVLNKGITIIPGIMTPSEIEKAVSFGLKYVKFFPAEAAGGINCLMLFRGHILKLCICPRVVLIWIMFANI